MANTIKIKRGLSTDISKLSLSPGELAITLDTREMYVGDSSGAVKSISSNLKYGGVTAGTTTAYTATTDKSIKLVEGEVIALRFHANCGANPTLNINGLGAKPIYYKGAKASSGRLVKDGISILVYDTTLVSGGAWHAIFAYDANNTYTNQSLGNGYGVCSTATDTAAKTVALSGYALTVNGRVSIKFDESVLADATLNINSIGAKAIYYKGAAITDNIILGGDIVTLVYNGTQYEIVNIYREDDGQELVAGHHISIVDNVITVNDLGDLGQLKTTKKDFIVNAINNLVDEDAIIRDEMAASTLNLNNSVESLNTRVSILENDVEIPVDKLANTLMTINETNGIDVGTEINTLQTKIDGNQVNIYSGDTNYLQIAPDTSTGEVKTKCEKFQTKQILCGYHERKEMLIGTEKRTGFFYVEGGSN